MKSCQIQTFFLWIADGTKTLLANSLITFAFKGNQFFSDGAKSLPENPPDCPILCNWVFDNFILAEELLEKALRSLETCVLVTNNLWGKLFLSLESLITFGEIFKITSVFFLFQILTY